MSAGSTLRPALGLLFFALIATAQTLGPPLFQTGWGSNFFSVNFGIKQGTDPGGAFCVSSVPNPYPNPKLGLGSATNCSMGSSLSSSTTFQSQMVNPPTTYPPETESGANAATGTRGNLTATATVSSFSNLTMQFIPVNGTNSNYYQENLPAPVSPGGSLSVKFHIQGSTGSFGCIKAVFTLVSDDPTQEVSYVPDGIPCFVGATPQTVNLTVNTPPLTVGPSGTYSIYIQLSALQDAVGTSTIQVSSSTFAALGDSYASGAGDKPYGTGPNDNPCRRSANGYPIRMNLDLGLLFAACGGAVIDSLSNGQSTQPTPQFNFVDESAKLVTVSIAGNDTAVIPMFELCVMAPEADLLAALEGLNLGFVPGLPCALQRFGGIGPTLANFFDGAIADQGPRLVNVYHTLRSKAPHARILALTYPNPIPSAGIGLGACIGTGGVISSGDLIFLRFVIQKLNSVIVRAALSSGIEVVDFDVDANSQFPFHDICTLDTWYLTPLAGIADLPATMHPNSAGEAEMARIILAHLASGPPLTSSLTVGPSQTQTTQVSISANQSSAVFGSTWPGSTVSMTLVSPSGEVIGANTTDPNVSHTAGPTFETYTVSMPQAGKWSVKFFGADVAPQGEPVNFALTQLPRIAGDANGDGVASCTDLGIVRASFGKRQGQLGFDPRADLNNDGVVDLRDLSLASQNLLQGTTCQ